MIEIRPLHQDEVLACKAVLPEGAPEPQWLNCWAVLDDGELVYFFNLEQRTVVEPMYKVAKENHSRVGYGAMTWIDGFLRGKITGGYEFFVSNDQPEFQDFIEKNLPVRSGIEKPGKYFFRRFEV